MKRADWMPAIVLAVVTALITYSVAVATTAKRYEPILDAAFHEQRLFWARYEGQPRSSLSVEEWLIRDFFKDRREGFFLDVGANHFRELSNTYYLETALGWSGLAIEPQTAFAAEYAQHRPRTRFVAMFASDADDRRVTLFVPPNNRAVASATQDFAAIGGKTDATDVPTTTLNRVLEQAGIDRIDFVSLDIELHEPQALAGFDIRKYRPTLLCVEAHAEVRQAILDYFQRHDYVVVGKYLRADTDNLYFMPVQP
jgi:FkbM family methyltransferase